MLLNQTILEWSSSRVPIKIYQLADDTNLMNFQTSVKIYNKQISQDQTGLM